MDKEKYSNKFWKTFSDSKRKLPHSNLVFRIGPAPKDEWNGNKSVNVKKVKYNFDFIGNLDCSDFVILKNDDLSENTFKKDSVVTAATTVETKKSEIRPPLNEIKEGQYSAKNDKKTGDADGLSVAGSHAILIYFARMSISSSVERLDYNFLFTLLQHGAEINISDRFGQTVMHEVGRNWNTDVAEFLIYFGADVNKPDRWGRTPLHIAAATNHSVMIKCLISNGANPNARTFEENQSVLHYAAKYDAVNSLRVLVDLRVNYNVRDYKGRTPLLLAAEMAQEGTVSFLLGLGIGVGVYDDTGMAAIGHMIEKMPQIAYEALNQYIQYDNGLYFILFYERSYLPEPSRYDNGRRKTLYYLNYLERDPNQWHREKEVVYDFVGEEHPEPSQEEMREKKKMKCPTTPLEIAVNHVELNIIMHPIMQALIRTKWRQFGQYGAYAKVIIHLIYVIIWSVNAIFYPRDGKYYTKQNKNIYWRLPVDLFCSVMASYFTLQLILENKIFYKATKKFSSWRRRQINRDIEFCHPGWSLEKTFLENEIKDLASNSNQEKVINPWNITEFIAYVLVISVVSIRVLNVQISNGIIDSLHIRFLVVSLLLLWVKFLKLFQVFPQIGTFFIMVGYAIRETLSFAILFILLAAPYTAGFWIIAQEKEQTENRNFNDVMYVTWLVTLNNVSLDALTLDKTMGQLMFACCFALISIICFNMYIGLLTETFYKVYLNAKAHASREQALSILKLEKVLKKKSKRNFDEQIQDNCGPKESGLINEFLPVSEAELWKRVVYAVTNRLDRFKDKTAPRSKTHVIQKVVTTSPKQQKQKVKELDEVALYNAVISRDQELYALRLDIYELKCVVYEYFHLDRTYLEGPEYTPLPSVILPNNAQPTNTAPSYDSINPIASNESLKCPFAQHGFPVTPANSKRPMFTPHGYPVTHPTPDTKTTYKDTNFYQNAAVAPTVNFYPTTTHIPDAVDMPVSYKPLSGSPNQQFQNIDSSRAESNQLVDPRSDQSPKQQHCTGPKHQHHAEQRKSPKQQLKSSRNQTRYVSQTNPAPTPMMNLVISNDKHGQTVLQPIINRVREDATIHSYLSNMSASNQQNTHQYKKQHTSALKEPIVLPTMFLSNNEANKVTIATNNSSYYPQGSSPNLREHRNGNEWKQDDNKKITNSSSFGKKIAETVIDHHNSRQRIEKNSKTATCQESSPSPQPASPPPPPAYCKFSRVCKNHRSPDIESSNILTESVRLGASKESFENISICSREDGNRHGTCNIAMQQQQQQSCLRTRSFSGSSCGSGNSTKNSQNVSQLNTTATTQQESPVFLRNKSPSCQAARQHILESTSPVSRQIDQDLKFSTPNRRYEEAVKLLNRKRSFDEPMAAKPATNSHGYCTQGNSTTNVSTCSHGNTLMTPGSSSDSFLDDEFVGNSLGRAIPENTVDDWSNPITGDRHLSIKLWTHYANAVPEECEEENHSKSDHDRNDKIEQHANCNVKIKRDFTLQRKCSDPQLNTSSGRNSYSSFSNNRRCSMDESGSSSSMNAAGNEMRRTSSNPGDTSTFFLQQSDNELFRTIMMLKMSVNALKYKCEPRSAGGSSSVNDDEII